MAKRINQLTAASAPRDDDVFAIDSSTATGTTNKITYQNLCNSILKNVKASCITTSSTFKHIHYTNTQYISSGCYTQAYVATAPCIVFWHIEWDCSGQDGLSLQIIDESYAVKGEIPIMRSFEANDSAWMNKNGEIPLGPGMGIRFKGANKLLAQAGNQLTYLVATLDK